MFALPARLVFVSARAGAFNPAFMACAFLVALTFPAVSCAGEMGIQVRRVSPALVEAAPGEIFTLSFRVTNRTDTLEEFVGNVRLPDGWCVVMPLVEFFLEPGAQTTRLVVVQAGSRAPAGTYEIGYHVKSLRDYALTDTASVQVILPAVYDLSLVVDGERPERVIAGELFEFNVRLINRGNADLPITIEGSLPGEGRVTAAPRSFPLAAGENRRIQVAARTDPERHTLHRQHLHLLAGASRQKHGRPVSARLSLLLEVVPLVSGGDMYRRYPVEVTGYLGGKDGDHSLQAGMKGSGYLDEARTRWLDFMLRAPDQYDAGALARRDEYRADYREPRFSVKAGDQSYALSKLTSWYRYGRGLGLDLHPPGHPVAAGMYHVRDRWRYQERHDTAGYIAFSPNPGSTLRLNLMTLDYESWNRRPASRDTIVSIEGGFDFRAEDHFEAEVGCSRSDPESPGSNTAWRSVCRGNLFKDVRYSLFGRRAGAGFAGRYDDTAHYSGTLTFPLARAIHGHLSYSRYESNLEERPERGAAARENLYQAGIRIKMPKQWALNLDVDLYDRRDAQPVPTEAFQERGIRVGAGRSAGPFSYRAQVRRVRTRDHLAGETHGGWNYDFFTTCMLNRTLFLSFTGSFGDDRSPEDSRLLRRGRNLAGSIRWQPNPDFSAYLNYSRYDQDDIDRPYRERVESDTYRAGLTYRLANNHRVGFDIWRSRGYLGDSRTAYFLKYTIPLSLPLGRKKSVGALAGRVYRSNQPDNPGVEGAVVYVDGAAARTDPSGRYCFQTLPPGDYTIQLDERTVGLDSIPLEMSSTSATVVGAETAEADIALTKAGVLSGRILIVPGNGNTQSNHLVGFVDHRVHRGKDRDDGGLGSILVEMSRSGQTRRTVTRQNGWFTFERLQPGNWTLRVYHHHLPKHHEVENPGRTVSINPGEAKKIIIKVIPRRRKIRFIDRGVVRGLPPARNTHR